VAVLDGEPWLGRGDESIPPGGVGGECPDPGLSHRLAALVSNDEIELGVRSVGVETLHERAFTCERVIAGGVGVTVDQCDDIA
jgi:hypothetical protein